MRLRFVLAAHPDHPLHRLEHAVTMQDLRAHRQLVVRETGAQRATPPSLEAMQRWTVSNMSTSIIAVRVGLWLRLAAGGQDPRRAGGRDAEAGHAA